ncbi:TetR/AcrR family transcriptional regulator [Streptomyces sp. NPDC050504]|uniref:TetR/AcrR family transcriptional regulator n=1 Tax=Streptomyces sp. NPDC050504 TaxID=3365618 RepID=UPI00378BBAD6
MPTARESLLDAALTALQHLPWSRVRMVDVASAAGVSRQTLYNEFGSKDGLARALVRREADLYLYGVERVLTGRTPQPRAVETRTGNARAGDFRPGGTRGGDVRPGDLRPGDARSGADALVALAEWTVGEARARPLLRALLTGCWGERLPAPRQARRPGSASAVPAQRRADGDLPGPTELLAAVRDRSLAVLGGKDDALAHRCELAARLALSHVVAPGAEGVGPVVRTAVSAPSPRAGGR